MVVTTAAERRGISRQDAGWFAKWRLAEDPASFECKVLDISMRGAGLETAQLRRADLIGRKITVTAQPLVGGSVSIRFTGVIRNVSRSDAKSEVLGGTHERPFRLGVEFADLSDEEITMLSALGQFLKRGD